MISPANTVLNRRRLGCDFGHRQFRAVKQPLGTLHTHGSRHLQRAGADVASK